MALFLSNKTTVPFCKDISETLYEDSASMFLHLDLRLANSITEIPIREDNAIGFCQKIRNTEQSGDGSSTPTRSRRRFAPSTTAKDSVVESIDARPSEADKSTMTNTAKVTPIKEILEPSEAMGKSVNLSSTTHSALQTQARKPTVPPPTPVSNIGVPQQSSLSVPSPFSISTPFSKTVVAIFQPPTAKPTLTPSREANTDEELLPSDVDPLLDNAPPKKPLKVSESVKTAKPTVLRSESSPLGSDDDLLISTEITAKKEDRPSVAVAASPLPNSRGKETGHKTSGTAGPQITMSSINSWYDYINTYMYTAVPTIGAAVSARALENVGVPRVSPAFWRRRSMLTQWLRRWSGEEDIETSAVVGGAGNDKEGESDEPSSSRVLAKPRPSPRPSSEEETKTPPRTTYLDETTPDVMASTQPSARPTCKPFTATKAGSPAHSMPNPETIDFEFPSVLTSSSHNVPTPTSSVSPQTSTCPSLSHHPDCSPNANQTTSETNTKTEPDADSVAWSKIHDPRIVWTVVVLWVLVGLQVMCGFWEFGKNVKGKGRGDLMGRVGWWDTKIKAAG
jgi:hypothetical protein